MRVMLVLSLFSISAFAVRPAPGTTPDKKGVKFDQIKSQMLTGLDSRISFMQEARNCVAAANNVEQLKSCRKKLNAHGKEMQAKVDALKAQREKKK